MTKDFLDELDKELKTVVESTKKEDKKVIVKENKNDNKKESFTTLENNNFTSKTFMSLRDSLMTNFPDTKFYLPKLRDGYTRIIPIGGHNEVWKNMSMYQYEDDIIILDWGMQFPEADMLWAKYSIPDISFLIPYKDKVKGMIITHGHLDHIGSLKHLLPALGFPTLYWTRLTIGFIKKNLEENKILSKATLVEVNQDEEKIYQMWKFWVEFFRQNHSIPDSTGIYVETPNLKMVHTWDFKFDFTPAVDKPADLARLGRIGSRGIDILMSDSTNSTKAGFTKSEKNIGISLDHLVEKERKWRMIIATFSSLISRIQQIVEACEKHDKYVFLSGRSMVENVRIAKELGFIKAKQGLIKKMTPKATEWIPESKQVIITTWSQWEEFSALSRMAEWTHPALSVQTGDSIVLSSTPIPGNERSVVDVINKLIKLGAKVTTNDNLDIHASGHAAQEEQKIMLNLIKPKYFMPIHGELFMRVAHKETAMELGIKEENCVLMDNWNIIDFSTEWRIFRSKIKVPLHDIIVDGHGIWTAWSHVIKAREKMMNSWVLVLMYKVDKNSKAILGHIKLETRGLVYLDEVRQIHRMVIKKAKTIYENTVKDVPEIEEKDLVKIIKTDLESFLLQRIDRSPMIIPMVIEV